MNDFCEIKTCPTVTECRYAGRCLNGSSALPPPETQGACERSRLATGSLPVSSAEVLEHAENIRSRIVCDRDALNRGITKSRHVRRRVEVAEYVVEILRRHAASMPERQPEENKPSEPRGH